jgi:leucyl aminopeptidase
MIQAVAEGMTLAEFDAGRYKTAGYEPFELTGLGIVVVKMDERGARDAANRGRVIGEHCNMARQLDNEPGNTLTPSTFAERLSHIARGGGLSVSVSISRARAARQWACSSRWGAAARNRRGWWSFDTTPAVPPHRPCSLGGKGITFDTGGISIKPAADMDRMKDDMAGGAAVACAIRALAELKAPIRVIGVIPHRGEHARRRALRPGDVLTSASGKTVEGDQHRRRRPADPRRCAVVRPPAWRYPPGRHRPP